jgi:hypothetical protein
MPMKNNLELVQDMLETRLDSLNEKIDTNNKNLLEVLGFIREQTTKTNGRVTALEIQVHTVVLDESRHVINCPRIVDIQKLDEKLDKFAEENFIVKVFNRWPKQIITGFVITVIITMLTTAYSLYQGHLVITNSITTHKTESSIPTK